jgi:hypothetical protein
LSLAFVAALVSTAAVGERQAPRMPGPAPQVRSVDAAVKNAQCETCHIEIAAEWQRSMHRSSHTDPVYQRAFVIEPLPFCQGCHAPEANPNAAVPDAVGKLGVGCVTCHWTGHEVLAAPRADVANDQVEAHAIVRDARFASVSACGSCHEFAFPDSGRRTIPELMQSTMTEHASSTNAHKSCADCHMPLVVDKLGAKPHRSHVFDASRNEAMVRRAVSIAAVRTSPTTARITIEPNWAGHAFPTGDLFRRIEVHLDAVGAEFQAVASVTRYLMRHFAEKRHGAGIIRYVNADDRPLGSPIVIDFDLGPQAAALPIAFRIAYQRVEHPRSEKPEDSVVEGEIILSEGLLPPAGKKQ